MTVRPTPTTAQDWHASLTPHLDHELVVHEHGIARLIVVVQCASYLGRCSLWVRSDGAPVEEARWRPDLYAPLFFGFRSVGCRTCQQPVAR